MQNLTLQTRKNALRVIFGIILGISLLVIILVSDGRSSSPRQQVYQQYLRNYTKKYAGEQSKYRQFLFYESYDKLIFSNKVLKDSYREGLNQFSSLTQQEFNQMYLMSTTLAISKQYGEIAYFENDYYFDWSDYMPPVKNERDFDIGHIFAVVAAVEFQYYRKNYTGGSKQVVTFSEQEIIDCCQDCYLHKNPKYTYNYIKANGILTDSMYPYTSAIYNYIPAKCKTENSQKSPYTLQSHHYVQKKCQDLANQLKIGPVVVGVDARKWRQYQGGVLEGCQTMKNHFALLVGMGVGYWKLRNSWGEKWGEKGYIRIEDGNSCGICSKASYPIVK